MPDNVGTPLDPALHVLALEQLVVVRAFRGVAARVAPALQLCGTEPCSAGTPLVRVHGAVSQERSCPSPLALALLLAVEEESPDGPPHNG